MMYVSWFLFGDLPGRRAIAFIHIVWAACNYTFIQESACLNVYVTPFIVQGPRRHHNLIPGLFISYLGLSKVSWCVVVFVVFVVSVMFVVFGTFDCPIVELT